LTVPFIFLFAILEAVLNRRNLKQFIRTVSDISNFIT
jgi:hypothetical protein